jgi:hypothetical protein
MHVAVVAVQFEPCFTDCGAQYNKVFYECQRDQHLGMADENIYCRGIIG